MRFPRIPCNGLIATALIAGAGYIAYPSYVRYEALEDARTAVQIANLRADVRRAEAHGQVDADHLLHPRHVQHVAEELIAVPAIHAP